jgi:hypothetical protein
MPNAHALDLLRRIYVETNEDFEPVGKSDSDKLNSLKIESAFRVLQVLSWREFFDGKTIKDKKRENKADLEKEAARHHERIEEIRAARQRQREAYARRLESLGFANILGGNKGISSPSPLQ